MRVFCRSFRQPCLSSGAVRAENAERVRNTNTGEYKHEVRPGCSYLTYYNYDLLKA